MKPEELGYLAGLIDGEGSVGFMMSRGYEPSVGTARVSVASTNDEVMAWLMSSCGGGVHENPAWTKRGDRKRLGLKPCFQWLATSERAAVVLRGTLPHLIIKREKAIEVLTLWDDSYALMRRPKRRDFHIAEVHADMGERGWPMVWLKGHPERKQ